MKNTHGQFNYRKSASPSGDPVRAQGESINEFVSLIKKYTVNGDVDLAGSFSKEEFGRILIYCKRECQVCKY